MEWRSVCKKVSECDARVGANRKIAEPFYLYKVQGDRVQQGKTLDANYKVSS